LHTVEKQSKLNFTLLEDSLFIQYFKNNPGKYAEELAKQFYYLNGSCYYLPAQQTKKTWSDSRNYCSLIGSNTFSSLYSYENNKNEFEMVVKLLEKYYDKSNVKELSFYIGLSYFNQSKK
jgi:hypothetical protein